MSKLTAERLRELLHYDPETGVFTRRVRCGRSPAGSVAGHNRKSGYAAVSVCNKLYLAHRLAWLYVYGHWPHKDIDHIDGNGLNNRLSNLRECVPGENHQNVAPHKDNISGLLGVTWDKQTGRWRSRIMIERRQVNLGRFDTPEEAHAAYLAAKKNLHTFNPVPRTTTTGTASNDRLFTPAPAARHR